MHGLYAQLQHLLEKIGLEERESLMLTKAYLCPGLSPIQLGKQCGLKRMTAYRILESLEKKGYLKRKKENLKGALTVSPLSLSDLAQRVDRRCADLKRFAGELEDLNRLLRYPLRPDSKELSVARYYGSEALEHFQDVHFFEWNDVFALGSFDGWIEHVGFEYENRWIRSRTSKGRHAHALFTTNGPATREIISRNTNEGRETSFRRGMAKDHWINAFPDQGITYVGHFSQDTETPWSLARIESPDLTNAYARLVQQSLK